MNQSKKSGLKLCSAPPPPTTQIVHLDFLDVLCIQYIPVTADIGHHFLSTNRMVDVCTKLDDMYEACGVIWFILWVLIT